MTPPTHIRATEIIAAYGADAARWPDDERAATLAALAESPDLAAARAAAAVLDADLCEWANAPIVPGDAGKAAAGAAFPSRPYLRWVGGTGLAAAAAAAFLVVVPAKHVTPVHVAVAQAWPTDRAQPTTTDDADAFAQVFTPTPDEEQVL